MRSRVYVTVWRASVCPSVCLSHRSIAAAAGLLLGAPRAGDVDRQQQAADAAHQTAKAPQQQMWAV